MSAASTQLIKLLSHLLSKRLRKYNYIALDYNRHIRALLKKFVRSQYKIENGMSVGEMSITDLGLFIDPLFTFPTFVAY